MIGSPVKGGLIKMTTHYEKIQALGNRMASNLETMGVSASFGDGGLTLADKILMIQHFTNGLLLYGDKDIIQTSETLNLYALLLKDGKAVSGETITFFKEITPTTKTYNNIECWVYTVEDEGEITFTGKTVGLFQEGQQLYTPGWGSNGTISVSISNSTLTVAKDGTPLSPLSFTYDSSKPLEIWVNKTYTILTNTFGVIGTDTTDSSGVATVSYTGKGTGVLNIQAKHGIISSEIYSITDCIFRDVGTTSDHNDNWSYNTATSINRGETHTTISENATNSAQYKAYNGDEIAGDFIIEWDNYLAFNNADYFLFTGTSDTPFRLDWLGNITNAPIKVVVEGLIYRTYVDGVKIGSDRTINNRSVNDGLKFRFQINDGGNPIGYSNFVIYPI